jgi:winged helix-turn-helix DNA-binding protein
MFNQTNSTVSDFLSGLSLGVPARRGRKPKVNYKSKSQKKTLVKQVAILEWLSVSDFGLCVSDIAVALGISRQLCLYHCKKLAAMGAITMVLEPCEGNGALRYRCWDETLLAAHYTGRVARRAA